MKKLIFTVAVVFLSVMAYCQNVSNVVYLENGSVIKCDIMEFDKENITIRTFDGSIFVLDASAVKKIEKLDAEIKQEDAASSGAQNPITDPTKRMTYRSIKGCFYIGNNLLGDDQLRGMIGDEVFSETYEPAKGQRVAGGIFIGLGIGTVVGLTVSMIIGNSVKNWTYNDYAPALLIGGILAEVDLDVGIPLYCIGKHRLSWIADAYNSGEIGKKKKVTLSFLPTITNVPTGNAGQTKYAFGATVGVGF